MSKDRPEFNNALEADAHNWDTRELERPDREIEEIVDDALTTEAIIVLNLDREKIKAIKDWTDNQINASYKLRETTIAKIIALIEEAKREEKERIIEEIDPYIKQVVDCDKHDKGYSLVDPVGLAALDYWWKAIKETNGG